MGLKRRLREKYGESAVEVPTASLTPWRTVDGVTFYCLCSGKGDPPSVDGHYGNNVLLIEYRGNRVLLPGDSDFAAWRDRIMPHFAKSGLLKSTILLASHHGSRSFFIKSVFGPEAPESWNSAYHEHLAAISPSVTIISSGDYEQFHHPNKTALGHYQAATRNKQVYLTREKGTLIGRFYTDGSWTVTPASFLSGWKYHAYATTGKSIVVSCKAMFDGTGTYRMISSGEDLPVNCGLEFTILPGGGLVGDITKAKFEFEVSNGGKGADADHDEIYHKGRNEDVPPNVFRRRLQYVGEHLLRCRASYAGMEAQTIFVIRGRS